MNHNSLIMKKFVVRSCFKLILTFLLVTASKLIIAAPTYPTETDANDVALKQIGAYAAWTRGFTGKGIRIGFVDTGADLSHPDLINVVGAKSPYYSKMIDVNRGHGTGMISLAVAAKDGQGIVGAAYDANAVVYAGGIAGFMLNSDINNGIKWAADSKADIINLSIGMRLTPTAFNSLYKNIGEGIYARNKAVADNYSSTSQLASLQYATAKGAIVVMAAGNDSNPVPTSPASLAVKSDAAGNLLLGGRAVIVGAVDRNNLIAKFSNRAGHVCQNLIANSCADAIQVKDYFLVAPGGSLVWEANANYTSATNLTKTPIAQDIGTSVSASLVSAGAALLKQAWPSLKPEQIVQIMLKTATDLGAKGVDIVYGNGLLNLDAATRPLGNLQLAKIPSVNNTQLAPTASALGASGLVGGVLNKLSFSESQVMKSAQVIDGMERNFSVDMTAGMQNSLLNYASLTPYSGLSLTSIQSMNLAIANFSGIAYSSQNLLGTQIGRHHGDFYWGLEVGSATERASMLGSKGFGALSVGDSKTNWYGVHLAQGVAENVSLNANWMWGHTNTNADPLSLITKISSVHSQSWTLGLTKNQLIDDQDSLSLQITQLPKITRGSASLMGVTGYHFSDITDEGATSTAIVTSENINLVNAYKQYAGTLAYTRKIDRNSRLKINYLKQGDNAGSAVKQSLGVQFVSAF